MDRSWQTLLRALLLVPVLLTLGAAACCRARSRTATRCTPLFSGLQWSWRDNIRAMSGMRALWIAMVAATLLGGCTPALRGPLLGPAAPGSAQGQAMASLESEQFDRAAIAFAKLSQDPSATPHVRQAAEHYLGVSLYRFGFPVASRSLFGAIAADADHAGYAETLRWLALLASELPEAANLGTPLSKYPEALLDDELAQLSQPVRSRVRYLLGRHEYANGNYKAATCSAKSPGTAKACHEYANGNYKAAIAQLEKAQGIEAARAHVMIAMCHVQMRKSVPAVAALRNAEKLAATVPGDREAQRLRDLTMLTRARIYFSTAAHIEDSRRIVVDRGKLNTAIHYWSLIDDPSDFSTDALWERAWAHMTQGAHETALADLQNALSVPGAYLPEAEQLEALVRWSMGEKDTARQSLQRFLTTYEPIRTALRSFIHELGGDAGGDTAFFALLQRANQHPAELPPTIRSVVTHALKDRELLGILEYARLIAGERRLLDRQLGDFGTSAAGDRVRRALDDEHRKLLGHSREKVRSRLNRELSDLDVLLREAATALERASE